jgi:hypothetical protein
LSADTALPLLVEHSKADIRLNTDGEGLLGVLPTPLNDFESRVQLVIIRIRADNSGIWGIIRYKLYNSEIGELSVKNRITPGFRVLSRNLLMGMEIFWEILRLDNPCPI